MRWFRVAFDNAMSHCVPADLFEPLVSEMIDRGHPITNFEEKYTKDGAASLGGNPVVTAEWAFDVGGSIHIHAPLEQFHMDGMTIDINCNHLPIVADKLKALSMRRFASGEPYFKAKFWIHAFVCHPAQQAKLIQDIIDRDPVARGRSAQFMAAIRRERERGIS